jgi:hypothetical protein
MRRFLSHFENIRSPCFIRYKTRELRRGNKVQHLVEIHLNDGILKKITALVRSGSMACSILTH